MSVNAADLPGRVSHLCQTPPCQLIPCRQDSAMRCTVEEVSCETQSLTCVPDHVEGTEGRAGSRTSRKSKRINSVEGPRRRSKRSNSGDAKGRGSVVSDLVKAMNSPGKAARPQLSKRKGKVFVDAQEMKSRIRAQATKKVYSVHDFYYTTGLFQRVAKHYRFENCTLLVITLNALWIAIETDLNNAPIFMESHPAFQLVEHLFCIYFSIEWLIRFVAFKSKMNCFRDAWFVFDSCLVASMILETWIMNSVLVIAGSSGSTGVFQNASMLRIARLLRLSRMARMARLFRAMPELLILIKAMAASLRSCFFVFVLLCAFLYVFGICFRQLTEGTQLGDDYFASVPGAMHTLWLKGTLLDNVGDLAAAMLDEGWFFCALFYVFVLLSALTVMNMLIGVLCEVVSSVAAIEKEQMAVSFVRSKLHQIIDVTGLNTSGKFEITKAELAAMLQLPEACKCLQDVGVDVFMLVDNIDFIFANDDEDSDDADDEEYEGKVLSFEEFMGVLLDLRGSNTCTVKDIVGLHRYIKESLRSLREDFTRYLDQHNSGRGRSKNRTCMAARKPIQGDALVREDSAVNTSPMKKVDCCVNTNSAKNVSPGQKDPMKKAASVEFGLAHATWIESSEPEERPQLHRNLKSFGTLPRCNSFADCLDSVEVSTMFAGSAESEFKVGIDEDLDFVTAEGEALRDGYVELHDAMHVLRKALRLLSAHVERECSEQLRARAHECETCLKAMLNHQYSFADPPSPGGSPFVVARSGLACRSAQTTPEPFARSPGGLVHVQGGPEQSWLPIITCNEVDRWSFG